MPVKTERSLRRFRVAGMWYIAWTQEIY